MPADWEGFKIRYRYLETTYHIGVAQIRTDEPGAAGRLSLTVDGVAQRCSDIQLVDDRQGHFVAVAVPAQ